MFLIVDGGMIAGAVNTGFIRVNRRATGLYLGSVTCTFVIVEGGMIAEAVDKGFIRVYRCATSL